MSSSEEVAKKEIPPKVNLSAPGCPGIPARWTSSAKSGVGTSLAKTSHVWFTLSHAILNEIYYPQIDQACVRDMGLIVTQGSHFFSEEKRDTDSQVHWLAEGVPAFKLINTCLEGHYRIEKEILTDTERDTLLQRIQFKSLKEAKSDYHLYLLLAPHLDNQGSDNNAWIAEVEGVRCLFAQRNDSVLACVCSTPWVKCSVSYVGPLDSWHDLKRDKKMTREYQHAEKGNISLMAEIDLKQSAGNFLIALGFGAHPDEAAHNAITSLKGGFDRMKKSYILGWQEWMRSHTSLESMSGHLSKISLAVLRTHDSKTAPGGIIASLSIPWGFSKGDNDLGGYHLVWPRDMVEIGGAFLAAGAKKDACHILSYLQSTQLPDGHWPQNMWVDGTPYWTGIQMDETALPLLLIDLAQREKALTKAEVAQFWPMVRQAASYLVRNGPVSPEDRWEEDPGYSQFTVGAQIAALLVAADLADLHLESSMATYLRELADAWNASIERWMYVTGTDWCARFNVEGYYVRIVPTKRGTGLARFRSDVQIKNICASEDTLLTSHLVSPDALALVRFGLRAADDPRILNTLKVIDALLKIETATGPTWHRYNEDGYGEHADGAPFDGTGIGRGWPLLTGERAHYEIAAGQIENAKKLLDTLESFAGVGGLLSEQIWDAGDIPAHQLYFGHPSGSAMPLVWAHAEYLKLQRSLQEKRVFDMPSQTVQRYLIDKRASPHVIWRFNQKISKVAPGKILRIETLSSAVIHWSHDEWKTTQNVATRGTGLGIYIADLTTADLSEGREVKFTFYWPEANHWEESNFAILIGSSLVDRHV